MDLKDIQKGKVSSKVKADSMMPAESGGTSYQTMDQVNAKGTQMKNSLAGQIGDLSDKLVHSNLGQAAIGFGIFGMFAKIGGNAMKDELER